jgi:hypothetical protein
MQGNWQFNNPCPMLHSILELLHSYLMTSTPLAQLAGPGEGRRENNAVSAPSSVYFWMGGVLISMNETVAI